MTDDNDTPCIRGCTWPPTMPGEEPKPKVAKGDRLICNSCYHRLRHALELIPDLMANMRMQMMPNLVSNYQSERVSGGGDGAPLQFRTSVLDASDSLYAKLV